MSDFPKKYQPKEFEGSIYKNWEKKGLFQPQESKT